ncbi:MAG: histidine kinase dimerization/phospho-acceptor domain-containing protein, partial [Burkholderiales bacterium]
MRLAIGALLGVYLLPEILVRHAEGLPEPHILVWIGFLLFSTAIFGAILASPGVSVTRRVAGIVLDATTLSWCMAHFQELSIPLLFVYLWFTIGHGFRYGARYLVASMLLSMLGFGIALNVSEYWQAHIDVGIGMMVGFVAVCLYVLALVRRMFDAVARAEAANQAKRRFVSVVSHEMRTPLNAIVGMADLMRDTTLTREQADMLQTLRGSSQVMLGLVEDVLDFSKIEAGKLVL